VHNEPGGGQGHDFTSRRPTPRPRFDHSTVVRREATAHHVWGDKESGLVTDRVYVSSDILHVLEFELGPGGGFRHSPTNKTIFAADVMYCVLEGELVIADPEHGEVQVVQEGEQVLFRRDTWHHGFNPSQSSVRVLEFFAPPPSQGTASQYARYQPMLEEAHYKDERWAQRWPMARRERDDATRLHVTRPSSSMWSFADSDPTHLVGVLADTEHLTVSAGRVYAGHVEDPRKVELESMLVVTSGEIWVDAQDESDGTFATTRLLPGDAVYVAAGSQLRVLSRSSEPATYLFGSGRPLPEGWTP
jgi:mannose-6-phosphate isomerase-like protein (cupin superfamily)